MIAVRRSTAVMLTADLYGGSAAAVRLHAADGRWPSHETRDRLDLAVGFAALALLGAEGSVAPRIRSDIMGMASSLTDALPAPGAESWSEGVARRRLLGSGPPGEPRIDARLVRGRKTPCVEIVGPAPTTMALSSAAAAVAAVALLETGRDVRLAAALAMEGVFLWCGRHASRGRGPRRAVVEGYRYAVDRLADARLPPPPALRWAAPAGGGLGC
jgi:hypothetical protein